MKRLVLLGCVLFTASLSAQTTTQKLGWDQPGVTTVAQAQALIYTLALDTAPAIPLTQTCALVGVVVSCTAPIATLTPGTHTLVLAVDNGFASAGASLTGLVPTAAVNLKVKITITVP